MRSLCSLIALLLLQQVSVPAPPPLTPQNPQPGTVLVRLRCTAANFPNCGMTAINNNLCTTSTCDPTTQFWRRTLRPGAGPQGQDAVELEMVRTATGAQHYMGWVANSATGASPGQSRFVRFRIKLIGPQRHDGVLDAWGDKFIIVGDGGDNTSRVIIGFGGGSQTRTQTVVNAHRNIDGPPARLNAELTLTEDVWHPIQVEMRSSTSTSSGNARLALWQGAAPYSSPTRVSGAFQLNTVNWGNFNVGFYVGTTLAQTGRVVFQLADVEYGTAFDPNWR